MSEGPPTTLSPLLNPGSWEFSHRDWGFSVYYRRSVDIAEWLYVDDETGQVYLDCFVKTFLPIQFRGTRRELVMLELLKKARATKQAAVSQFELVDEDFAKKFPTLFCFLAANVLDDGEVRQRSSISLFAEGGNWKACLNDKDAEVTLFVTMGKPQECFATLEKALGADKVDWRRSKGRKPR